MRKGITPVIAMILLILIVVALGGVFAAWTTRTWESLGESGEAQVGAVTETLSNSITIDNVDCNGQIVYVRNTGTGYLNCTEIGLYVDSAVGVYSCSPFTVGPGNITTITVGPLPASGWTNNERIRVTTSGNSASYRC